MILFISFPFRHQVNKWHSDVTWFCITRDINKLKLIILDPTF